MGFSNAMPHCLSGCASFHFGGDSFVWFKLSYINDPFTESMSHTNCNFHFTLLQAFCISQGHQAPFMLATLITVTSLVYLVLGFCHAILQFVSDQIVCREDINSDTWFYDEEFNFVPCLQLGA